MTIPKTFTTVTRLSKTLAAILFIALPFIGFFLGMKYEQKLTQPQINLQVKKSIKEQVPQQANSPTESVNPTREVSITPLTRPSLTSTLSMREKALIDLWIKQHKLNEYGDPKDMMYTGGNPLFDEKTGVTKDQYAYILQAHPDRPWNK